MADGIKKLTRSKKERVIFGICGGLAVYFNIDPIIVRVLFVISVLCGGAGVIAYLIMLLVVPEEA